MVALDTADICGVEAGGVEWVCPGMINGNDPPEAGAPPADPRVGGAEAGGKSPRDLRATIKGLSVAGCCVLLVEGT